MLAASFSLGLAGALRAETLSANGMKEISVQASGGDLVNARRLARESAEKDAVAGLLKIKLSANLNDPRVKNALPDLRTQLTDNFQTKFMMEGDILTAKSTLQVDAVQFMDLSKSLGITSKAASASAKVLFLIDEYYGVGTKLDPSQPLLTEIDYSHDKSSFSDQSSASAGARSASSSSASAAKASFAASGAEKSASAASSSSAVAARDRQSFSGSDKQFFSGSDRAAAAYQDGAGGSAAAARNTQVAAARSTQVAGARDAQFAASEKSASANSSASQFAVAATSERASAAKSASASSFSNKQTDVQKQNDIVNYKVRQVFPGIDNAKPSDDSSAMINQKLQQVIAEFGLVFTDERDFRVEGGRKMTIAEIAKYQKYDAYLKKAAQGSYKAKYLVYGTAIMQSEGQTSSGGMQCAGQLSLTSSDVDTGDGFVAGTITKRAIGSTDQNCRANLAEALARSLADTVGTRAQRELQQASTQGRSYTLTLYSALSLPSALRRQFTAQVKALDGLVEMNDDGNASDGMRRWTVVAKGNFSEQIDDLVADIKEAANSPYHAGRFEKQGNRMVFCVEGKCPQEY